jgi:phage baseplate assembly protein W
MLTDAFLGVGWSFPPTFPPAAPSSRMVSGVDDIHQSIEILLRTRLGERLMQEPFGCDLDEMLFAEVNASADQPRRGA